MDKNAIKKYAVWARKELIARVTQKAEQYEITEKKTTPADADSIGGRVLTAAEKKQRQALIVKINQDGFEQVMEEVAYTWFNRFTALRFMEVNNYLPSHTRVFTNENGEFKPQILADAIQLDLEGLNMDKVFELKDANKTEELYKYLLITQCNALSGILPRMFQRLSDYTELLLPDYLLREGSVIEQMIALITEEDWTDQVQIIGWLYQYYNSEPKDAVFAALKKNVKISKENIPAATQLFTPDWIVRYMVENSLGRLWLEGHPNDALKSEWKYYLDEAEQEEKVQKQLDEIRKEYAALRPEEIRCIDPCMGSGHILCYMFDVLVKIYEDYGYTVREAVENIIKKNLWGLDIDERAAQLSYFAVMMKARQYDRRFFNKKDENGELCIPQPHVYAIEESNGITFAHMHDMGIGLSQEEYEKAVKEALRLVEEMHDTKEYGSIIHVTSCDWDLLRRFAVPRGVNEGQMRIDIHGEIEAATRLQVLINIGEAIAQKYHVVITNPPYMSSSGMDEKLLEFVKSNYLQGKSDMSTVFMMKNEDMCCTNGFYAMINIPVWMFISSYTALRRNILDNDCFVNMLHLGRGVFGSDFGTTSFVIRKSDLKQYKSFFLKLHDEVGNVDSVEQKEKWFFERKGSYYSSKESFELIPSNTIAYWLTEKEVKLFVTEPPLREVADPRQGLATGNDAVFLRSWCEVSFPDIGFGKRNIDEFWADGCLYAPFNKGGAYRKWYGNNTLVIRFSEENYKKLLKSGNHLPSRQFYFHPGITWSALTAGDFSGRYCDAGFVFAGKGPMCFPNDLKDIYYIIGFLNSKLTSFYMKVFSSTTDFNQGPMRDLPLIMEESEDRIRVEQIAKECISIAKEEWDSYELSWDYKHHPFISDINTISEAYERWDKLCADRFVTLKEKETEINKIFARIYGLEDEIDVTILDKSVSIRKADICEDVKSFISYAVGCMFGRYSLDVPALVYAGGDWDASRYKTYQPDRDNIIPICDDEYFEDDIVGQFVEFVRVVFGNETLEENLQFIASAIGGVKDSARMTIRNYFINDFFADHCSLYSFGTMGKRPIYWLFDSGKKNGFKCLIYIHRYKSDTLARIRTDYVHEQQSRYRTAISEIENQIISASTSERVRLNKKLQRLKDQTEEIRLYEEKIHHLADQMITLNLDDGITNNYKRLQDVLAKLK